MNIPNVIAIIIALLAAAFAGLSWWNARQTTFHHVLADIRKDYLSPQMGYAVKTLWQFYNDCKKDGEDFVEKYCRILKEDKSRLSSLEEQQRVEAERSTLHYQRRLVSHFYQYVAALYANNKRLLRGIVFRTWTEKDLRIIPNIIIPIEIKLREVIQTPPLQPFDENALDKKDSLLVLYRLYRDSKES